MNQVPLNPEKIRRILLIRLRNIGDVLLMVPAIRAFREAFPRAHIAALVNGGTEEMLTGNPMLDEILVFDQGWKKLPLVQRLKREGNFLWQVRRRGFDLAVNFTEGDRGAFLCQLSGARYKVGPDRLGKGEWWKKRIFSHLVPNPGAQFHTVEQMLAFPRSLGLPVGNKGVEIFYSSTDQEKMDQLLSEQGIKPGERLVHFHPTARWLFKCWRDEGVAKVIDELQQSGNIRVVLSSGREEKELRKIHRIVSFCRTNPVNLAGRTSLKHLAVLSQRSLLFIGVDTAPMHIAAAVGTPVIALFGPSGEYNWGPWGNGHVVIKKDWECRPCGKDGCQGSKRSLCLEAITEGEVLEKAFHFLDQKG